MPLKVVGAGLGRTGTNSLRVALERLLGSPCYHMYVVRERPEHVALWQAALDGKPVDWDAFFAGYAAAVDWPTAALWEELSDKYPESLILFSRRSAESWWNSASETIFPAIKTREGTDRHDWYVMVMTMFEATFTGDLESKEACIKAFEAHENNVLSKADPKRLVVWEPGDGWGPLCEALHLPVPDEPYPVTNTKDEFIENVLTQMRESR